MSELKFTLVGVERVAKLLATLKPAVKREAFNAIAKYIIGDERHGLKHSPPRVTHGEGNPYQWQSDKQRKAYFASDGFGGGIPYQRTGELANAWSYAEPGENSVTLTNSANSASFVIADDQQRGHAADGWRHVLTIIETNLNGAYRAAQAAVDNWINKNA